MLKINGAALLAAREAAGLTRTALARAFQEYRRPDRADDLPAVRQWVREAEARASSKVTDAEALALARILDVEVEQLTAHPAVAEGSQLATVIKFLDDTFGLDRMVRRDASRLAALAQSAPGTPEVAELAERVRRLHSYAVLVLDAEVGAALELAGVRAASRNAKARREHPCPTRHPTGFQRLRRTGRTDRQDSYRHLYRKFVPAQLPSGDQKDAPGPSRTGLRRRDTSPDGHPDSGACAPRDAGRSVPDPSGFSTG